MKGPSGINGGRGRRSGDGREPKKNESDGEWKLRFDKRSQAITLIKASKEYEAVAELRRQPGCKVRKAPRTPSPGDRSLSKRQWETSTMRWRQELRKCYEDVQRLQVVHAQSLLVAPSPHHCA